ncbi:MAG: matrixin family metalloprotease [Vampirovibrionales bacterium]
MTHALDRLMPSIPLSRSTYLHASAIGYWLAKCCVVFGLLGLGSLGQLGHAQDSACTPQFHKGLQAYRVNQWEKAMEAWEPILSRTLECEEDLGKVMYYTAMMLQAQGNLEQARMLLERTIEQAEPDSNLQKAASQALAHITQTQMKASSQDEKTMKVVSWSQQQQHKAPNYLPHVLRNGQVTRWNLQKMPLKIFVESGAKIPGWKPALNQIPFQAGSIWTRASGGKITFTPATTAEQADIHVKWINAFSKETPGRVGEQYYKLLGQTLVRSEVSLATGMQGFKGFLPPEYLLRITTHEMGHALGLQGHSPFSEDLMYWEMNQAQTGRLTLRDINTLRLLYHMEADVDNNGTVSHKEAEDIYTLIEQADKALQQKQYAQAEVLYEKLLKYKNCPNQHQIWYNVGVLKAQRHEYQGAILAWENALKVQSSYIPALYNLSQIYFLLAQEKQETQPTSVTTSQLEKGRYYLEMCIKFYKGPQWGVQGIPSLEDMKAQLAKVNEILHEVPVSEETSP